MWVMHQYILCARRMSWPKIVGKPCTSLNTGVEQTRSEGSDASA
jgi:hypothetical protein